ncbi:hypothetical protein ACFL4C_00890, partial [Candidatus Omnitrophota bacterium]
MSSKDDINFLNDLRSSIDKYLFLGYAPSVGSPGHDGSVDVMEQALLEIEFQDLRKRINESKQRAIDIIRRFGIKAIITQYPPAAVGGPIIEQHLLDVVTENLTWQRIPKTRILDVIDQT